MRQGRESPSLRARWSEAYKRGLGAVILAYCVCLGSLLAFTDGLPYVLDNNETFSSLIHARNMLRFDIRETRGLTDEAYGLAPAQHPYVYTHGGNFPRLYTLLLYVLGARSAEAQIVVTTFSVGLLGLLLAYRFWSRAATPMFALAYCLLLMTDQVMQTQWLVNTWRAWHHFFVFSSLLCVDALVRKRSAPRLLVAITLLNFACLVYLEMAFAATVTILAFVYSGLVGRRRPGRVFRGWLSIVGGATVGAAVLVAQLIGYYGWEGLREDVRLTFFARNAAATDLRAFRAEVWSFVEEHHLVFWDNFLAGTGTYSGFFRWCLLPYTPLLVFIALLISTAWAMSLLRQPAFVSRPSGWKWSSHSAVPWVVASGGLFACAVSMDASFAGLKAESPRLGRIGVGIAGAALVGLAFVLHRRLRGWDQAKELPAGGVVGSVALLLAFATFARLHPLLYGDGLVFAPLFRELIEKTGGPTVWLLCVLGAAVLAVSLLLRPSPLPRGRRYRGLFLFAIAGVIAVATIFFLLPGYVASGYLARYCPLSIYVHILPLAAAFYVLARMSLAAVTALAMGRWPRAVLSSAALFLLCLLSSYWLVLQARWITGLDPRATLLKELEEPQYRGASFVVNAYAAPVAYITGGWAYFDPQLGKSEFRRLDGGFYQRRDFRYLWLADKHSNREYFEPDYFVCFTPPQLIDVIGVPEKCQELRIVAEARAGTRLLGHREVSRDASGRDAWSILKLNWTDPSGSGKRIEWDERQYRRALALP